MFLTYLYYNITLHIPTYFGPQWTFIRDSNKVIEHKTKLLIAFIVYYFVRFPDDGPLRTEICISTNRDIII